MPTYDYHCEKCGHRFEAFQSITKKPLKKCPSCGAGKVKRLIGAGAGLIFKGSGFYCTDYRKGGSSSSPSSSSSTPSSGAPAPKSDACANCPKAKADGGAKKD